MIVVIYIGLFIFYLMLVIIAICVFAALVVGGYFINLLICFEILLCKRKYDCIIH